MELPNSEHRNKKYYSILVILSLIAIPIIIYFYFLKWKTNSLHDDDLTIFNIYKKSPTLLSKLHVPFEYGKFRPVHDFIFSIIMQYFKDNFNLYYLFNVAIQSINTYIFAKLLNIFLKSPLLSLCFSLLIGLSRLSYYNMFQLVFGGAMEGLAMTFFLLFLFFIIKALTLYNLDSLQRRKLILWSILFANLATYTHERYIVLLIFIIFSMIFIPGLNILTKKQKAFAIFLAIISISINVVFKKYVYLMPFFVGTADSTITFSIINACTYLLNGVLTIFLINTGPEYLCGLPYSSLSVIYKLLVVITLTTVAAILLLHLLKAIKHQKMIAQKHLTRMQVAAMYKLPKTFITTKEAPRFYLSIFLFLIVLFFMLLAPAVVTVRIELRWLQASFSVLILMLVIAISCFQFKSKLTKYILSITFILVFLCVDYNYLDKGAQNLYFSLSARTGDIFNQAIKDGTIRKGNTKLYLMIGHKNPDRENEILWALGYGKFFDFYQKNPIQMIFIDSIYQKKDSMYITSFPNFNRQNEQIVFLDIINDGATFQYKISDITNNYLKDSLKSFKK